MTDLCVEVDDRSGTDLPEGASAGELARVMEAVLTAEGAAGDATAGLHLVTIEEITELNEAHMESAGPTDVLSFPVDGLSGDGPVGEPILVGDVLLSPEVAVAQADSHAGTAAAECRLLVVHGTLHLAGWDHDTDQARRRMWERERELLAGLDMLPPSDPWASP